MLYKNINEKLTMLNSDERRQHLRVNVHLPLTINVKNQYIEVVATNMSVGGALAEIKKGNPIFLQSNYEGSCFFEFNGEEFDCFIKIIRRIDNKVAFQFVGLTRDHLDFLNNIIAMHL